MPPGEHRDSPHRRAGELAASAAARVGNEERFGLLVDSVRDYAIIMLDREGRVASWNAGARDIKQYAADEIIGRHFSVFYPPEAVARGWPDEELRLARQLGRYEEEGWRVRRDGSTFWSNVVITPLHDEEGELIGYAKIARDMTDRKHMAALEAASRRMTDMLAMLAHELRNPLAPMRNATAMLEQQGLDAERLAWCRDVLERQVSHLSRLVDDLLDVGRIATGKVPLVLATVEARTIVERVVKDMSGPIEAHGHALEVALPERALWLRADASRLHQVLFNLLDNAVRYTLPGGTIRITAEEESGRAVLRVSDTGMGIPAALLPQIFDIFVQGERPLDRPAGGLGVGLALVKSVVEQHEGQVEAYSAGPGLGAQIVVRLPLTAPPAAKAPVQPAEAASTAAPARRRILVVDDNQDSADSMAMLLAMEGYAVRQAYHGRSALETAAAFEPDAVLLDIGLPEISGYEVALRLRELPGMRDAMIIAMTGYGQEEDRQRAAAAGFTHHLVKPVELDTLRAVLARLDRRAEDRR